MQATMEPVAGDVKIQRLPATARDGARAEVTLLRPAAGPASCLLYWLPAMGVSARHYLPLAAALAARGVAVALHEWRGLGSSNRRAGRRQDWAYRELLEDDLPAGLAVALDALPSLPLWLGGHSLGGQLACLYAGRHAEQTAGLVLVASGAPYWRSFRHAWPIRIAYGLAPWLAALRGHLPGRWIGFGGNEARGVIGDWSRSGRSGRYAAAGLGELETGMARYARPLLALRLRDDWLGPAASLDWLLARLPQAPRTVAVLAPDELQGPADHFSWMKAPGPVAARIAGWLAAQPFAFPATGS
ncbi:alpha/beta hydrolase family protein [Frateuria defendens]|uniref:alpha/beta hydrolase family protein n=1 Tax=Frateuria defendens TaxID=2219559 RepID=UPI00069D485A|nr:alpha/beta fold hydrolase [Frateuria defendens]